MQILHSQWRTADLHRRKLQEDSSSDPSHALGLLARQRTVALVPGSLQTASPYRNSGAYDGKDRIHVAYSFQKWGFWFYLPPRPSTPRWLFFLLQAYGLGQHRTEADTLV